MLKRLRRKFCAITLLLVGLVLVAALGSTFVSAANTQGEITRSMLEKSLDMGFAQPPTLGAHLDAARLTLEGHIHLVRIEVLPGIAHGAQNPAPVGVVAADGGLYQAGGDHRLA